MARILVSQAGMMDANGTTAMIFAIDQEFSEVIDLLIDFEKENINENNSSLVHSIRKKSMMYKRFIKYAGKSNQSALYAAIHGDFYCAIDDLIENQKENVRCSSSSLEWII